MVFGASLEVEEKERVKDDPKVLSSRGQEVNERQKHLWLKTEEKNQWKGRGETC